MNSTLQRYAAVLLPFFVLTVGATDTVLKHPGDLTVTVPFAILVLGAIGTYVAKLLDAKWQGGLKTGIAIATTILSAVLPFILPGGFDPAVSVPVIIVAVLNALATQLGVAIRVDPVLATANAAGVHNISSLPAPHPALSSSDYLDVE